MADTWYVDLENGNDGNTGASFAQRWKTLAYCTTAHGVDPGDTVRVMASPAPTSLGQSATWTDNSGTVTLTTAVTATIDQCDADWTDDEATNIETSHTNVTTVFCKEGSYALKCNILAGFGTGKASYKNTATLVLDDYSQISFWILSTVATAAGNLKIKLCSDNSGATPVYSFDVPALVANRWTPVTVDQPASALMTTDIESVALYVDSDLGAMAVYLDHIIACKPPASADSLSLLSLISLNTTGETWYPIKTITGTAITLDCGPDAIPTKTGKWATSGTTPLTQTTYKRETIKLTLAAAADTAIQTIAVSGTLAGGDVTFSGGWNRTDMSTQDTGDVTWLDGRNGWGYGVYCGGASYLSISKIYGTRYANGWYPRNQCRYWTWADLHVNGNSSAGIRIDYSSGYSNSMFVYATVYACCNGGAGFQNSGRLSNIDVTELIAHGNGTYGLYVWTGVYHKVTSKSNGTYGVGWGSSPTYIENLTTANNTTGPILVTEWPARLCDLMIRNATISEAITFACATGLDFIDGRFIFQDIGGLGIHEVWAILGNIKSEVTIRHTASGISWKMSPTHANREARFPLNFVLATVAVKADVDTTFTCYMRRSHANLTGKLVCRGEQIVGVASDVTDSVSTAADEWDLLSITIHPTAAGVIQIEAWAYGGTTYSLYVDDLTITGG